MNMMPTYLLGQGNGSYLPVQGQGHGGFMQGNFPPIQGQSGFHPLPVPTNYPPPPGQGNFSHFMQGHGPGTFMPGQGEGNFLPGQGPIDQSKLTEEIINDIKSQGLYDQFRRECVSDADMKPAYRNLKLRVESNVMSFLDNIKFTANLNKIQLRELLRKHITDSKILDTGVERMVEQLVVSKINTVLRAKVEEVVYKHLGIENPSPATATQEQDESKEENLLPKDLEAVSSDSSNDHHSRNRSQIKKESTKKEGSPELASTSKVDSPHAQCENTSENITLCKAECTSSDVSGFSGLDSHDDSNHSSYTKRSLVASEDRTDSKTSNDKHKGHLERKGDKDKSKSHRHHHSGKSDIKYKSVGKHVSQKKDRKQSENSESSKKDSKEREKNIDKAGQKSKENRDRSDSRSDKVDKLKEKSEKERPQKEREHLVKDKKLPVKDKEAYVKEKERPDKSKSIKEKSTKDKIKSEKSKSEQKGEKLNKDTKKCDKEKFTSKEIHHKSQSLDKDRQDRPRSTSTKHRSTSSSSKKDTNDDKTSAKEKSSSSKSKDKHPSSSHHKHYSSDKSKDRSKSSSSSKDKVKKSGGISKTSGKVKKSDNSKSDKKEGKKVIDDHYSFKDKKYERRSTDRDSNDDSSKNNNFREDFLKSQKGNKETDVFRSGCTDSTYNPEKVKQEKNNDTEDMSTDLSYISEKVKQEQINEKEESSNLNITETEIMTTTDNGTDSSNMSVPETEQHRVEQETTNTQEDSTTKPIFDVDKVKPETTNKKDKPSHINITETEIMKITENRTDSSNLSALETEHHRVEKETTNPCEGLSTDSTHNSYDLEEKTANTQEDSTTKSIFNFDKVKQGTSNQKEDSSHLNITETEIITITDNETDSSNLSASETEHHQVEQETTNPHEDSGIESTHNSYDMAEKTTNIQEDSTSKPIYNLDNVTHETTNKEVSSNLNITETEIITIADNGTNSSNLSVPETETFQFENPFKRETEAEDYFEGFSKEEIERSDKIARKDKRFTSTSHADDDDLVYYFEKPHESEAKLRWYNENISRSMKFIEEAETRLKAQFKPKVKQAGPSSSKSRDKQMTSIMEYEAATRIEIGKKRKLSQSYNNNGFNCNDKLECKQLRLSGDQNQDDTNICDVTSCNRSIKLGSNKNEKTTKPAHAAKLQKNVDLASKIGKRQLVVNLRREVIASINGELVVVDGSQKGAFKKHDHIFTEKQEPAKIVASANDRLTLDPDKKAGNNGFKKPKPVPVKPPQARRKTVGANQRYSVEDLFKPRRTLSSTSSRRRPS